MKASISDAVIDLLSRNQAVFQCLRMNLVNYHALAALIKPSVDSKVGKDVSVNTIVVAIKRFSDAQAKLRMPPAVSMLRDAKITLTTGMVEATIKPRRGNLMTALRRVVDVSHEFAEPAHVFPLISSIKVIVEARDFHKLKNGLGKEYSVEPGAKAAKLAIQLAEEAEKTPGVAAYLTDLLYRSGINILSAVLGFETILIINEADGSRAFTVLNSELAQTTDVLRRKN